jgi:alpha-L-fucosidase
MRKIKTLSFIIGFTFFFGVQVQAQITEMWNKTISDQKDNAKAQWFQDAKFGLFVHWGLFAQHAGEWNGKRFYGISEWVMNRGKIPVADYSKLAQVFNPIRFNAEEWVKIANEAGIKYMVITSKHHEGFAMFDSKVSDFNIMNTPFKRDPLKELSVACQKGNVKLGFYYSQFLDWHEPNGGGNDWDFVEKNKDYKAYYNSKSIPQIRELLSNYGKLGLIWFDMPGGLSKEETQALIDEARKIQPTCLLSSRVGQGLGDFRDFGDGEVPSTVVKDPWEAIFTHNDSWGYSKFDNNFKTPSEIIRLLTNIVSKGGNLMLNVGPKADGTIPEASVKCLKAVGEWLKTNGDAIYGTTYGPIAPQPWGVTTQKPNKLFLHVMECPKNGELLVPEIDAKVKKVTLLSNKKNLVWKQDQQLLKVFLPSFLPDEVNTVIVVEYEGKISDSYAEAPAVISPQYNECSLEVIRAKPSGNTKIESITYSLYFGDWKHMTCATMMQSPSDDIVYNVQFSEPGDYKIFLEYSCPIISSKQEGLLQVGDQKFYFETLETGSYDAWRPLMFIQQSVAMITVSKAGLETIKISPLNNSKELFKLSRIIVKPIK